MEQFAKQILDFVLNADTLRVVLLVVLIYAVNKWQKDKSLGDSLKSLSEMFAKYISGSDAREQQHSDLEARFVTIEEKQAETFRLLSANVSHQGERLDQIAADVATKTQILRSQGESLLTVMDVLQSQKNALEAHRNDTAPAILGIAETSKKVDDAQSSIALMHSDLKQQFSENFSKLLSDMQLLSTDVKSFGALVTQVKAIEDAVNTRGSELAARFSDLQVRLEDIASKLPVPVITMASVAPPALEAPKPEVSPQ